MSDVSYEFNYMSMFAWRLRSHLNSKLDYGRRRKTMVQMSKRPALRRLRMTQLTRSRSRRRARRRRRKLARMLPRRRTNSREWDVWRVN
jgi:hypothetical protein